MKTATVELTPDEVANVQSALEAHIEYLASDYGERDYEGDASRLPTREEPTMYVVIENTPGYLPDEYEPATFEDYAEAVEYLNERAAEYADNPDGGYRVEYGIASADNLAAVIVHDDSKTHDLGRVIQIVIDEEDEPS